MKRLVLALSTLMVLTLPGWGQNTAHDQAKAAAAAHREEARSNPDRPHHAANTGIIIGSTPAHSAREEGVARELLNHPPGRGPSSSYAELSQAIARLKCLIRLGITLDDVAESRDPSFLLS